MARRDTGLDYMMKLGYTVVLVTVGLMVWASMARARELDPSGHPPCAFNALCSCSKSAPDLGIVRCHGVLFPAVPKMINTSKLYSLTMDGTGLRVLEPHFLQATGLYRLALIGNPLTDVPDEAFYGLERSLWELALEYNQLIEVPSRALRNLRKLRLLSLRGNGLTSIEPDAFRGVEGALQSLVLAENGLVQLAPGSLAGLPNLETLDLSGNGLLQLDPAALRDGLGKLARLILADNLLEHVPYDAVSPLDRLRTLSLARNRLQGLAPDPDGAGAGTGGSRRLTLDTLDLAYNEIRVLAGNSFGHFDTANVTLLDGNPLHAIDDDAFRPAKIRELYVRHCDLGYLQPEAFAGLEGYLQVLDLSGNNLTELPDELFRGFDSLRHLNVKDNVLRQADGGQFRNVSPIAGLHLYQLDMVGQRNKPTTLTELGTMQNLRSLALSAVPSSALAPEHLAALGPELEELRLNRASLKSIKNRAFTHVRGLKRLDLSENRIDAFESDAFADVGHSLVALRASHGLGSQLLTFPVEAFRRLTALEALDLSNNRLKALADGSLHLLRNLVSLELHDNQIETLAKGTFQADLHTRLATVSLRYNSLRSIATHTFVELPVLTALYLDDNRIETIERRAFMNLDRLKLLNLRGNRLTKIADEAFQNLPELEKLDLSYNELSSFDFDFFDQIGSLTTLEVDVSHNRIKALGDLPEDNATDQQQHHHHHHQQHLALQQQQQLQQLQQLQQQQQQPLQPLQPLQQQQHPVVHSNIRSLDFSHNNISRVVGGFFRPAEQSLMRLELQHNRLGAVTRDLLGTMPHLHWLDLSSNRIAEVEYDALRTLRKLQVLKLSRNALTELPAELFRGVHGLRVLEMAHNSLKYLPDGLVQSEGLERLDVSHNQLTKIPVTAISNLAAMALCELDLSHNHIGAIHSVDLNNKFRSLAWLDLSHNRLVRLEDAAFATLPRLATLDLSHNDELEVMGRAFIGLEGSLIELRLANVSLGAVPELASPSLRTLQISHNELPSIPPELAANLSALRSLDLSENDLTNVPLITHSLPNLRNLYLAGNPITTLTNTSLLGAADTLESLDIANLQLHLIETGVLNKLHHLRSLRISTYPSLGSFNIPRILENANNLRELWIEAPKPPSSTSSSSSSPSSVGTKGVKQTGGGTAGQPVVATDLRREMDGELPRKLRTITIGGTGFSRLSDTLLRGVQAPTLHFRLHNTSIVALPANLFRNIGHPVRNVSVTIDSNNDLLQSVPNPNTAHYLALPEHVFLTDLSLSGSELSCDCEIGWIEFWQRKRRQYLCPAQPWTEGASQRTSYLYGGATATAVPLGDRTADCERSADELREARCSNRNHDLLLEVLKKELECGWGSAATRLGIVPAIAFVLVFIVLLI
ncbi:chaoptin isoform X2 [Anopheles aquasalis]|uniref:chaoptin isoform X2 n=1 Tax=Anopheles aquasalis TaxID=42839 RepID=UPI00215B6296|nr:chaoptin isoform X2 [Anopheles aquasalis]XP_050098957.1 chaoptin isoform X2 [Anopheles aquasalis]